jgi:hypothetical protein
MCLTLSRVPRREGLTFYFFVVAVVVVVVVVVVVGGVISQNTALFANFVQFHHASHRAGPASLGQRLFSL